MDRPEPTENTRHDELDEFAPEAPLRHDIAYAARRADETRRPLSQSARALSGYAWAMLAFIALRCDSMSYVAARGAKRTRAAAQRWRASAESALRSRRAFQPIRADQIDEREMEGSFVAAALACAVVAYGAMLAMTWRDPVPHISAAAGATPDAVIEAPPAEAAAALLPISAPSAAPVAVADVARVQRPPVRMSAASLRSIWNRGDTRSLERALTHLRQQTLTLHRCGMQVTATDQAVARCDGPSRESYTIDFRRTSGRWSIQRVSRR